MHIWPLQCLAVAYRCIEPMLLSFETSVVPIRRPPRDGRFDGPRAQGLTPCVCCRTPRTPEFCEKICIAGNFNISMINDLTYSTENVIVWNFIENR